MSAASPDSTLDGPSGSLPSRFRRSLRVLGLGALGAFALASTHCGAPPPEAPEAARGDSAPPASSEQVAPSIEPDFESTPAEPAATCSDQCSTLLSAADVLAKKVSGVAGTDAETALAHKATTAAEVAWRGCLLRQPGGPDRLCEGSERLLPGWVAQARLAKEPDAELYAQLVLRDPRWRPEAATIDDTRLLALIKQAKAPGLVLAALVVLRDPHKVLAFAQKFKAKDPLDKSAQIGASTYFNDSDMAREALRVLPPSRPTDAQLELPWLAQKARHGFASGDVSGAMKLCDELQSRWNDLDPRAKAKALARKEPYPLIGREAVVAAVGTAQYLRAENLRLTAEKLQAPSTASLRSSSELQGYYKAFTAWLEQRHAALEEATEAYVEIARIEPVAPANWVVEGMRRVGEMWRDFAAEMNGIKFPAEVEKDAASVKNLRRAIADSAAPLSERAKKSFAACVGTGRRERVATDTVELCAKQQ
ncbi:MAG: hypothetical protein KC766_26500 [Myxococcales bacterium]|nr:hypothetical protein [Myxococcales bacterium]